MTARRSVLYVPGSNERALEKAKSLDADALIYDLEDAVAPDMKQAARDNVAKAVRAGGFGFTAVTIRINGLTSHFGADDLVMAISAEPDAILLPKVERGEDILAARQLLAPLGPKAGIALWAMIETPLSLFNLKEIASVGASGTA